MGLPGIQGFSWAIILEKTLNSARHRARAYNPSTWKVEAGESGIQGHLQLCGEAEAGLAYLKPRLRKPTNPP